ncbi:hypothetical protein [Candidatus Pristimantibacillus sp. PTI5]|uniref:hypothetical protein n=1 Tax=Candidatus Pristimantibacillus sp. PTI5 TaxID=3400422 RepID=UPI003B020FEE
MKSFIIAVFTFILPLIFQMPDYTPGYSVSYDKIDGVGAVASIPDTYHPLKKNKFVVFFHGNSGPAKMLCDHEYVKSINVALLDAGYVVIGSDYSLIQNWGNPQSVKETESMIEYYKEKTP